MCFDKSCVGTQFFLLLYKDSQQLRGPCFDYSKMHFEWQRRYLVKEFKVFLKIISIEISVHIPMSIWFCHPKRSKQRAILLVIVNCLNSTFHVLQQRAFYKCIFTILFLTFYIWHVEMATINWCCAMHCDRENEMKWKKKHTNLEKMKRNNINNHEPFKLCCRVLIKYLHHLNKSLQMTRIEWWIVERTFLVKTQ